MPFDFGSVILGVLENEDRRNEQARQFNEQLATNKEQFNASLAEQQSEFGQSHALRAELGRGELKLRGDEFGLQQELGRGGLEIQKRYANVAEGDFRDRHQMKELQLAGMEAPGDLMAGVFSGKSPQDIFGGFLRKIEGNKALAAYYLPLTQQLVPYAQQKGMETSQRQPTTELQSIFSGTSYVTGDRARQVQNIVDKVPGLGLLYNVRPVGPTENIPGGPPEKNAAALQNFRFSDRINSAFGNIANPWAGTRGRFQGEFDRINYLNNLGNGGQMP